MTEPTSMATGAVSATATGAVVVPFLAALGIDVQALLFVLLGAVIVQCLLPDATRSLKQIATLTIGGMLLAGVATPLAMAYVTDYFSHVPAQTVHNVTAAAIGGFAQPLVMAVRSRLVQFFGERKAPAQTKES